MEEGEQLLAADGEHLLEGTASKELGHAELLQELPVRAARAESERGGAIGEVADGRRDWARGDGGFMGLEHFLCSVGGAYEDGRDGAEAEMDDLAVALGELMEGLVWNGCKEVEVADDGEGEWAGR